MVKAGKRDMVPQGNGAHGSDPQACDPVMDDVDELIMSLDCVVPSVANSTETEDSERPTRVRKVKVVRSPGIPEEPRGDDAVPWLDRFESTNALIDQLEDTLKMMERKGINLTNAWELANTARSLLDSADVAQALIYANRSFRLALDVHRFPESGVAAS
jgi:hypothetical protein